MNQCPKCKAETPNMEWIYCRPCKENYEFVRLEVKVEDKYNWIGNGPDGCDNHCIPHPCGPCITGKNRP